MKATAWTVGVLIACWLLPIALVLTVATVVLPVALTPIRCGSADEEVGGTAAQVPADWRPPFTTSYVRTSPYGQRLHPVYREWRLHTGQDLAATAADGAPAAVVAVAAGVVRAAGREPAWGNIVTLDHGGGVVTRYAHLARIAAGVRAGERVGPGHVVGVEGATGAATGTHLHFQVEVDDRPVNPVPFMAQRGAPLNGRAVPAAAGGARRASPDVVVPPSVAGEAGEGGIGFVLPAPGEPRQQSLHHPPLPIPRRVERLYRAAGHRYRIPWTLLAGIGMQETGHGRNRATSWAGARGLMQFLPVTFADQGVDGNGDGRTVITDDADSIYSAANYLTRSGALQGPTGVRAALRAYNRPVWYANDVLHYAAHYGGGTVYGDPHDCGPTPSPDAGRAVPPLADRRVARVLAFAASKSGGPYVMGANGPRAYDCSSLTQAAYATVGIQLPRTAAAQRNWLAAGNGIRIPLGKERPGDLVFWDSYLGPNQIGHVVLVWDPRQRTTIEARSTREGIGRFSYSTGPRRHIFQIWRVGDLTSTSADRTR